MKLSPKEFTDAIKEGDQVMSDFRSEIPIKATVIAVKDDPTFGSKRAVILNSKSTCLSCSHSYGEITPWIDAAWALPLKTCTHPKV